MFLHQPSSARSASWIVPSHNLHLKSSATSDKSPRTPPHRLWIHLLHTVHWTEFACTPFQQTPQYHFPEFTIIFPPLLPTITLDFPAYTFNPLPSRLALQSATRLPSCSIVGAIITRSSAYSNSKGRPLLASLETTCWCYLSSMRIIMCYSVDTCSCYLSSMRIIMCYSVDTCWCYLSSVRIIMCYRVDTCWCYLSSVRIIMCYSVDTCWCYLSSMRIIMCYSVDTCWCYLSSVRIIMCYSVNTCWWYLSSVRIIMCYSVDTCWCYLR